MQLVQRAPISYALRAASPVKQNRNAKLRSIRVAKSRRVEGRRASTLASSIPMCPSASTRSFSCPEAVDPTQFPAFKSPNFDLVRVCSSADIAALNKEASDTTATFTDLFNSVPPACQACVFSSQNDATWQIIVWQPDMASGTAFVNFGACYAVAPGGSVACGKGISDDEFCLTDACPDECTDHQGCETSAVTNSSKP